MFPSLASVFWDPSISPRLVTFDSIVVSSYFGILPAASGYFEKVIALLGLLCRALPSLLATASVRFYRGVF